MHKSPFILAVLTFAAFAAMLGVSSWSAPDTIVRLQPTPTATSAMPPAAREKSWIIVDLPANATQLEYGAEVYRLVCKACHGDKGQGLTDDWRAQWAPQDQNCWQSKCHARNHPPDGFYMPISPAVVGPPLKMFDTALDLYSFIHTKMPWYNPGSMTEKDSWSVTAYILKINNVDPGPDLNPQTAAEIRLREEASSPPALATDAVPSLSEQGANRISPIWISAIIATAVLIAVGIFSLRRR